MNNYWYYALSSIAQTLGAITALSATFVIFKLDQITRYKSEFIKKMFRFFMLLNYKKEMHDFILPKLETDNGIIELLKPIDELVCKDLKNSFKSITPRSDTNNPDIHAINAYDKCHEYMESLIREEAKGTFRSDDERLYGYLKYQQGIFYRMINNKNIIYSKLKCSLILNAVTICLSLFLILYHDSVDRISSMCPYVIIIMMTILAIISISYTAHSMWKISHFEL